MAVRQPFDLVVELVERGLSNAGYSLEAAGVLARNCVQTQYDGSESHGLFRLRDYVSTLKSGYLNPAPEPKLEDVAPGFLRVDADNGFAQIAIVAAAPLLKEKAEKNGIVILAVRNSHHLGALYHDIEGFAEQGLIAIAVVNSMAVVAPPGGKRGVYGTNPIAFAAPRASGPPLVFDLATSTMAHGDVLMAAREGRLLPDGTGVDSEGDPTSDPHAILNGGALSTFGGHKGAAISLMVEILCAALVGADFSYEVDWTNHPGAITARTGETIIVIDPRKGAAALPSLAARVDALVAELVAAGQARMPGDRRLRARDTGQGFVSMSDEEWQTVKALASMEG